MEISPNFWKVVWLERSVWLMKAKLNQSGADELMVKQARSVLIYMVMLTIIGTMFASPAWASLTDQYHNPIKPNKSADPSVYRDTDGTYYYMTTAGAISIWKSKTLTGLGSGERKVVWSLPASGPNSRSAWAPELHKIGGAWYIYYTAASPDPANPSEPDPMTRRLFVIENTSEDPMTGAWTDKGQVTYPGIDFRSIDPTVMEHNGELYIAWSTKYYQHTDDLSRLYIAKLSNPWTMSTLPVEISEPTYAWESVGNGVNEGPEFLKRNGKVFLIYSTSGCWTDDYKLGMLSASSTANLLNPSSWTKKSTPVFTKSPANGVYGPGHNSFSRSADGEEDYLIYHANPASGLGCGGDRELRIQKFTWNTDGTPNFGTPAASTTALDVPAGEPLRLLKEAEDASLTGGATFMSSVNHYTGTGVVKLDASNESITWNVNMGLNRDYTFDFRYAKASSGSKPLKLLVNGTVITSSLAFSSTDSSGNWSEYGVVRARASLQAGNNTVKLESQDADEIRLDSLTVYGKSFEDDFNDGNANGWTTYAGTWAVNSGNGYEVSATNTDGDKSIAAGISYTDFVYDADITLTSGAQNAGLLFRVSDPGVGRYAFKGYNVNLIPGTDQVKLVKFDGTSFNELVIQSLTINTGQKYHVKIIADGANIRVVVDGELIINHNDSTYTNGGIGLRAVDSDGAGKTATFDDVELIRYR
jgi:GH43 family beta-xylosidase